MPSEAGIRFLSFSLRACNLPSAERTGSMRPVRSAREPPTKMEERVLELRAWTEVTLDAMLETIRSVLSTADIRTLAWEHPFIEGTHSSTAAIQPSIERLQLLYPPLTDVTGRGPEMR